MVSYFIRSIITGLNSRLHKYLLVSICGSSNLKFKKGIGLLCGAWGYTFCIMYRAFIWRMEVLQANDIENHETLVLKVLSFALIISFPAFIISFIKSFPKKILE